MYRTIQITILAAIAIFIITGSHDGLAQTGSDSIVFRAMEDEIARSMGLSYKDMAKPCYISYELSTEMSTVITAEMGALMSDAQNTDRGWSYRLIVGTNDINDENFSGQSNVASSYGNGGGDLFPVEDDYYGIRRAFWMSSDEIYKRAGANHREKMKLIEDGKITAEMLKLSDFSEARPVTVYVERKDESYDLKRIKEDVISLSDAMRNYPELKWSGAAFDHLESDVWAASSEGSRYKIPVDAAVLALSVIIEDQKHDESQLTLSWSALSPSALPSREQMQPVIEGQISKLMDYISSEVLETDYTGPVLLEGMVASEMLLDNLFTYEHSLFAERNNLVVDESGDIYFENLENEWQSKLGKKILPAGVGILATSKMKQYNGIDLLGSFSIDCDGVVPPDTIVLVEDGLLKNMLSTRTPTSVSGGSNGHYRHFFSYGTVAHYTGPGVLQFVAGDIDPADSLKAMLMRKAKDEGLDYAIIIRSRFDNNLSSPYYTYKVDLETGAETMIKKTSFSKIIKENELRKLKFGLPGTLYNDLWKSGLYNFNSMSKRSRISGLPVSFIGPGAILVNEMKVTTEKETDKIHTASDDITNPLKQMK